VTPPILLLLTADLAPPEKRAQCTSIVLSGYLSHLADLSQPSFRTSLCSGSCRDDFQFRFLALCLLDGRGITEFHLYNSILYIARLSTKTTKYKVPSNIIFDGEIHAHRTAISSNMPQWDVDFCSLCFILDNINLPSW
jgi:hypothetical protein